MYYPGRLKYKKAVLQSLIAFLVWLSSCAPSSKAPSDVSYDIDFSSLRPVYMETKEVKPFEESIDTLKLDNLDLLKAGPINARLYALKDTLAKLNSRYNKVRGYTILLYRGTDRSKAEYARAMAVKTIPDIDNLIFKYRSPDFIVTAGKFYDRLSANGKYAELKSKLPYASLVPTEFKL